MASDQDEIVFTLVSEIISKVSAINGDGCIQYIDQNRLYVRVAEMFTKDFVDPANILEIVATEMILFTQEKKNQNGHTVEEHNDMSLHDQLLPSKDEGIHVDNYGGMRAGQNLVEEGEAASWHQLSPTPRFSDPSSAFPTDEDAAYFARRRDDPKKLPCSDFQDTSGAFSTFSVDKEATYFTSPTHEKVRDFSRGGAIPKKGRYVMHQEAFEAHSISPTKEKPGCYAKCGDVSRVLVRDNPTRTSMTCQNQNVKSSSDGNSNELEGNRHNSGSNSARDGPPTNGSPTNGSPTDGSPTDGSPTNGSSTNGSSTDGSPTDGSPTDGSPTDDSPTDGSPTDGSPTDGSPTDGSPTDGSPTDGSPSGKLDETQTVATEPVAVAITNQTPSAGVDMSGRKSPVEQEKGSCPNQHENYDNKKENSNDQMTIEDKEQPKTESSIGNTSYLDENGHDPPIENIENLQTEPAIGEESFSMNTASIISEAVENDSSLVADVLPSDGAMHDSDQDSCNNQWGDLSSSSSNNDFEICDDLTEENTVNNKPSEVEKTDAVAYPTSPSESFDSLTEEVSEFSLMPHTNASNGNEPLKLNNSDVESEDTCEQFSMLSGASSLNELTLSDACDNKMTQSAQDDRRCATPSSAEPNKSDIEQISSEYSSHESISILHDDGNDDSDSSSVMVLHSPISMNGSTSDQDILECSTTDDSLDKNESSVDTFEEWIARPSVDQACAAPSSTLLTARSNSSSDECDMPHEEYLIPQVSVRRKVRPQQSSHPKKKVQSEENFPKADVPTPPPSPVAAARTTTTSSAAGPSSRSAITQSALLSAHYLIEAQEAEHVVEDFRRPDDPSTGEYKLGTKQRSSKIPPPPQQDDWMTSHCKTLCDCFPDVDEKYLFDRCQEVDGCEGRFEALLNELVFMEGKPPKRPAAAEQQYISPKRHVMSMVKDSPVGQRAAKLNDDYLDMENTIVDGIPLFHFLQQEEDDAGKATPPPEDEGIECGCCYTFYPVEEMRHCEADEVHLFCHTCIRRYCETQIGESKYEMRCLSVTNCQALFSTSTLMNVLETIVFKKMMINKQAEEITTANIEDLETCPFCPFSIIFDEKATPTSRHTVFRCDNPDCGKRSCRLCQKADHSPAKCEEVQAQTNARTHLENEMTDAMVRECVKCRKRFIKTDGCNLMTCSCGAKMCYICKKPVQNYGHFDQNQRQATNADQTSNRCPLYTQDLAGLHAREVQQRADALKNEIDPNLLLNDPTKQ